MRLGSGDYGDGSGKMSGEQPYVRGAARRFMYDLPQTGYGGQAKLRCAKSKHKTPKPSALLHRDAAPRSMLLNGMNLRKRPVSGRAEKGWQRSVFRSLAAVEEEEAVRRRLGKASRKIGDPVEEWVRGAAARGVVQRSHPGWCPGWLLLFVMDYSSSSTGYDWPSKGGDLPADSGPQ